MQRIFFCVSFLISLYISYMSGFLHVEFVATRDMPIKKMGRRLHKKILTCNEILLPFANIPSIFVHTGVVNVHNVMCIITHTRE